MSSSEERKEEGEAMQVDPTESEVEFAEEEAAEYRKVDSEESRAGQWDYLPEAKRPPVKGKKTFQMIFDSTKESVVKYNEDKHGEDLHDFLNRSRVANLPQELKEVETTLYCPRPSEKKGEKTADHSDDGRLLLFGLLDAAHRSFILREVDHLRVMPVVPLEGESKSIRRFPLAFYNKPNITRKPFVRRGRLFTKITKAAAKSRHRPPLDRPTPEAEGEEQQRDGEKNAVKIGDIHREVSSFPHAPAAAAAAASLPNFKVEKAIRAESPSSSSSASSSSAAAASFSHAPYCERGNDRKGPGGEEQQVPLSRFPSGSPQPGSDALPPAEESRPTKTRQFKEIAELEADHYWFDRPTEKPSPRALRQGKRLDCKMKREVFEVEAEQHLNRGHSSEGTREARDERQENKQFYNLDKKKRRR